MTTFAAMLGALPLALGTGTGSELRRPLGITIIGGLLMSQALTLFTTPVVYLYFDRLQHWWERVRGVQRRSRWNRWRPKDENMDTFDLPIAVQASPVNPRARRVSCAAALVFRAA